MENYTYSPLDRWVWSKATSQDVPEIVDLSYTHYKDEFENIIFKSNMTKMHYHLHQACLDQIYGLGNNLILIARNKDTNKLMAWNWIQTGKKTIYSDDEMAIAEFIHVDLTLPKRDKIALVHQSLEQWIVWCTANRIPVICSTSIRPVQSGFMKIHERLGFFVRGSYAYKRIEL
ncbi:MAG TPA: hypothetical protein VFM18_11780 [Methanosarcina sp.]|nr:hypothetical protein [Methanosarcina sp.]